MAKKENIYQITTPEFVVSVLVDREGRITVAIPSPTGDCFIGRKFSKVIKKLRANKDPVEYDLVAVIS